MGKLPVIFSFSWDFFEKQGIKNYEKNVKSVKFVILTIAIFIYMTIMIFGSWHSGFLSANRCKIMLF